jgi:DNA polymerase-3 subunit delta'
MSQATVPWPASLAGTPAVAVLERAVARGRLSHGLLLAGDDAEGLSEAAMALADRLLSRTGPSPFPPERHPDCLQLRPAGRSRQISVGSVRGLISRINVSPAVAHSKVAVLHEADRMNAAAANSFLKTLEEPPADTTVILLSTKPYSLLPTIRSRVLHFRLTGPRAPLPVEGWQGWLDDYQAWLGRLGRGLASSRAADAVFGAYGLLARFSLLLERASAAELARRKGSLPEGLEEGELEAIEVEISIGLRQRMLVAIEGATRTHAHGLADAGEAGSGRLFAAAVDVLERDAGLLRANLNEATALEDFLLASLRTWTKR